LKAPGSAPSASVPARSGPAPTDAAASARPAAAGGARIGGLKGDGVFQSVDEAAAAAKKAQEHLAVAPLEKRPAAVQCIRDICIQQAEDLGKIEFDETQIGRLDHKIEKLVVVGNKVPGMEFLRTDAVSGDHGLCVTEYAPYGVIGVITPVTHSVPT